MEVSLRYNTSYTEKVYSFCNNIFTPDGGMHLDGFRQTLSRVINAYAKDNNFIKKDDPNLTNDDLREGLTAIISVKHPDPQYEGQTKGKLGNAEVRPVVNKVFGDFLKRYLLENPDVAKIIMKRQNPLPKPDWLPRRQEKMSAVKTISVPAICRLN